MKENGNTANYSRLCFEFCAHTYLRTEGGGFTRLGEAHRMMTPAIRPHAMPNKIKHHFYFNDNAILPIHHHKREGKG